MRKARKTAATEDFTVADMRVLNTIALAAGGASGAWLAWCLDLHSNLLGG